MSTSVVGLMLPGIAETPLSAVMVDCAYAGTLQTNSNATTLLKAKTRPAFRGIDMPPFSIDAIFRKRMERRTLRSHALGSSSAQETVARFWARRRVVD